VKETDSCINSVHYEGLNTAVLNVLPPAAIVLRVHRRDLGAPESEQLTLTTDCPKADEDMAVGRWSTFVSLREDGLEQVVQVVN